ncbi:hypothetical protein HDV00_010173 [Rhizophlyctis rosea]|nr:hypothetical protein HDV00_010173 [Rhizophlyctis rosea]
MPRVFTESEMREYLTEVGTSIATKRACSVVVIGGAVSVLVLRNRDSTEDIDIITFHLDKKQSKALFDAAKKVAEERQLRQDWINNNVDAFYDSLHPIVRNSVKAENLIGVFGRFGIKRLIANCPNNVFFP